MCCRNVLAGCWCRSCAVWERIGCLGLDLRCANRARGVIQSDVGSRTGVIEGRIGSGGGLHDVVLGSAEVLPDAVGDFTEGGADVGLNSADTVALAEAWGIAIERAGGRLIADIARATETELVTVSGVDPLLARPLYALIETPPLTATIIDYLEDIPDSAWRESGVDIDI